MKNKNIGYLTIASIAITISCSEPSRKLIEDAAKNDSISLAATKEKSEIGPIKGTYILKEVTPSDFKSSGFKHTIKGGLSKNGELLAGYPIQLLDENGNVLKEINTASTGKFAFDNISSGNYKIAIPYQDVDVMSNILLEKELDANFMTSINETNGVHAFAVGEEIGTSDIKSRTIGKVSKDQLKKNFSSSVEGQITSDESNIDPSSITLLLLDKKGRVVKRTHPNSDGTYKFEGVSANSDYSIVQKEPNVSVKASVKYIKDPAREAVYKNPGTVKNTSNYKENSTISKIELEDQSIGNIPSDSTADGSIRSTIINSSTNEPVAGEEFWIADDNGKLIKKVASDEDGNVKADGLPKGKYHVVPKKKNSDYVSVASSKKSDTKRSNLKKEQVAKLLDNELKQTNKLETIADNTVKIAEITKQIEIKKDDAKLYYERGNAKMEMGNFKESIEDYNKAIELKPEYKSALMNRAESKEFLFQFQDAISDYNKVLELAPNDIPARYRKANVENETGQYADAITDFDKVIALSPDFPYPYFYRGVSKANLGNYKDALTDFDQTLKLENKIAEAHFNKGSALFAMSQYAPALESYQKTLELNPSEAEAHLHIAQLKEIKGDLNGALIDYEKTIELNPNEKEAYIGKASLLAQGHDAAGALKSFDETVAKFPDDHEVYYHRALYYQSRKKKSESVKDLDKAIQLSPETGVYYKTRGEVQKDKVKACEDFTKAKSLKVSGMDALMKNCKK